MIPEYPGCGVRMDWTNQYYFILLTKFNKWPTYSKTF